MHCEATTVKVRFYPRISLGKTHIIMLSSRQQLTIMYKIKIMFLNITLHDRIHTKYHFCRKCINIKENKFAWTGMVNKAFIIQNNWLKQWYKVQHCTKQMNCFFFRLIGTCINIQEISPSHSYPPEFLKWICPPYISGTIHYQF